MRPRAFATPLTEDIDDAKTSPSRVVLVGPSGCGKTTLLLRACVRFCRDDPSRRALFVARRRDVDRARVWLTRRELEAIDRSVLERVGMRYVETDEDVRALACFRHCAPASERPGMYAVDDLGGIVGGGGSGGDRVRREIAYARTLAALHECARDEETGTPRAVVVSERTDDTGGAPMRYVYAKWFGEVLQVHEVGDGEYDLVSSSDRESVRYSTRTRGD